MKSFKNTREFVVYALPHVHGKTLDFGAGNAKYKSLIKPHASTYIAFDIIPSKDIDIVGDVLNAPFENESFDTIISTQVLEHVEKPWIMVKEISRITKKGGVCILTAPFMQPYHSDPYDFFRYTKKGLESLFTNEGFEIVESGTYGKVFSVIADMINFAYFSRYKKRSRLGNRVANMVESSAHMLDRILSAGIVYSNVYIIVRKR